MTQKPLEFREEGWTSRDETAFEQFQRLSKLLGGCDIPENPKGSGDVGAPAVPPPAQRGRIKRATVVRFSCNAASSNRELLVDGRNETMA